MTFVPTDSQRIAIETVDRHLAVTAGAGSGKTRVLVERYLNLVKQGTAIEEIAAITFTKKAAQEMKDRLRQTRPDLTRALEQAQISTIHSLCQRIVEENPLQAGIDPRFRIGEEWENQALLFQVVQAIIEAEALPEEVGDVGRGINLVFNLYQNIKTKGPLSAELLDLSLQEASAAAEPLSAAPLSYAVEEFLRQIPSTERQREVMGELQEEWPLIQELLNFPDLDLQLEALKILSELIRPIRGKLADYTAPIKDLIAEAEKGIQQIKGAEVISWLSKVLKEVDERYTLKKSEQGILDFADLETLALELLQSEEVRSQYNFKHLMVDEFQDTNPIQKQIVDCFVEQGALLFVVGDPKQSIYRFRGADVGVFLAAKREIETTGLNVFLAENFRSRPELIRFANHFFPPLMQESEIPFEASKESREKAGKPCVTFLRTNAKDLNIEEGRVKEAEQIAIKIRTLVEQGSYKYEDIALLFRATTNIRIYERALQAAGIPYVNLSGRGFYSQQEVRDVIHYFNWLQDGGNQVSRLAVLRSPFYLLSNQALYWIQRGELDTLTPQEISKLEQSEQDYRYLKGLMEIQGAPQVISAMLTRTDYLENTWRLPFGPQKVANVEKLLDQSWQLYAQGLVSGQEQLRYIELMSQDRRGEGEALLDAEHADVVVLMTVHGAKGLEFPVVFLPDTSGGLFRPQGDLVLYHPQIGLAYKGTDTYEMLKNTERAAEKEELKRLLYVAVTRAEEKLYWCGLDDLARASESWWRWLQAILPEIPPELFRELDGELGELIEHKEAEEEISKLIIPEYQPLKPQYHQVAFSVTSLMNYVRCPRYFYLRYVLGVPEWALAGELETNGQQNPGLTAVERGNIVHRVCEQIEDPAELDSLLAYAAEMEDVQLTGPVQAQLKKIIRPYLQSEFFQRVQGSGSWDVFREREFIVPAGNFLINGLVDQVFVSQNGLEIVDFKSNWIKKSQVETVGASYWIQLRLYAWAMVKQFNLPVLKSQAYFLIPNATFSLAAEYLNPDLTEQWVQEICEEIIFKAEQGLDAFSPGLDCKNCRQLAYCGKIGGIGENTDDHRAEEELV